LSIIHLYLHNRIKNYAGDSKVIHRNNVLYVMSTAFGGIPRFIFKDLLDEMIVKELLRPEGKNHVRIINEDISIELDLKVKKNMMMW